MEVPEINEIMLEGESNTELINQGKNSGNIDESALQNEDQKDMEPRYEEEAKLKVGENVDNSADNDLHKHNEDSQTSLLNQKTPKNSSENLIDREQIEEPVKKKLKLDDRDKIMPSVSVELQSHQTGQDPDFQTEHEQQSDPEAEYEEETENHSKDPQQFEESESKELLDGKREDEKIERRGRRESGKSICGADTDMLATLASAALEKDPNDKTHQGTPKSPAVKQESEIGKKKSELWCNVGVFDTNTTIVSEYIATPEPNEHVDLVSATLAERKIQLEPGTAYKFRVCAVNGCGTGPWSDVAAFKTTLPGFPGAPSAIKISKSPEGAHLTWEPPGGNSSEILEYAVYLAVRSASQGSQPVTTNQAQLAFVRVFCGPTNKCMVGTNSLQAAHIDTTTKPAIIFRIAARNSKGYGPATQVRWLQESKNGGALGPKRAMKS